MTWRASLVLGLLCGGMTASLLGCGSNPVLPVDNGPPMDQMECSAWSGNVKRCVDRRYDTVCYFYRDLAVSCVEKKFEHECKDVGSPSFSYTLPNAAIAPNDACVCLDQRGVSTWCPCS